MPTYTNDENRQSPGHLGSSGEGPSTWRLIVALVSVLLLLARCGLSASQEQAEKAEVSRSVQNFVQQHTGTPAWHGCPIEVGVDSVAMGTDVVGAVKAAALDITERTDFALSVVENPESARLWVTRVDPSEPTADATSDPGDPTTPPADATATGPVDATTVPSLDVGVTTVLQHEQGVITVGAVNVASTVPADRLEWELRRALGHLLVGQADMTSPLQMMGDNAPSPVSPDAEPPYDVEAVRGAGSSCIT